MEKSRVVLEEGEEGRFSFGEEKTCHNHGEKIRLYCTSCEEGICEECRRTGPHDSDKHETGSIGETVLERTGRIEGMIESGLREKREGVKM